MVGRNGGLSRDGEDLREEVRAGPSVGEEVDVLRWKCSAIGVGHVDLGWFDLGWFDLRMVEGRLVKDEVEDAVRVEGDICRC